MPPPIPTALKTRSATAAFQQILLFAGHNPLSPPPTYSARTQQSPSNPYLTPAPLPNWLGSVGRAEDIAAGFELVPGGLASGLQHNLIAYSSAGVDRVFSVGRNEVGQLGVGWNSQESSRGMVEGFRGDRVISAAAAVQSSYLVVKDGDSTSLFVFGSLQRGRLGHPSFQPPTAEEDAVQDRELSLFSRATKVGLPDGLGRIAQVAVGFEHLLILAEDGRLWGTGCSTDGQLGLGHNSDVYELTEVPLPSDIAATGGVASVHAGADTSGLITKAGHLFTWGNSEYSQAAHGRKDDQILTPTLVDPSSFLPTSRRIVDFRCGGSFSLILDNAGSVYSVGLGALGLGESKISSDTVSQIPALKGITRIRAGFGWAAAVRDLGCRSSIYTWGVNSQHGRLGLGSRKPHVYEPEEVGVPLRELGLNRGEEMDSGESRWRLGEVELGEGTLWASLVGA